jgi:3-phenylpropionate/trans-cinnamate dioxygenase ferredoxin reductase subunit
MSTHRVVIVGASMAGLRAAEGLRQGGWSDEIVVIGDEASMPYNRPPLSKDFLLRPEDSSSLEFRVHPRAADVQWRLGAAVTRADIDANLVWIDDEAVSWDGLVIATGLRPRRLDTAGPAEGRYAVRTHGDAAALHHALRDAQHLVVVGAGFLGCEVAAVARTMGVSVDVVAPEVAPMERPLGAVIGAEIRRRHEATGIRFHLGVVPAAFIGGSQIEKVELSDGTVIRADVVVEAVGGVPNVDWLAGNGLDLSDGVRCDARMRVARRDDIVACGDIARFPAPHANQPPRRLEHWSVAADSGRQAGLTLSAALTATTNPKVVEPSALVPSFWSDQGAVRLRSFGWLGTHDDVQLLDGDASGDCVWGFYRSGRLIGVLLIGALNRAIHFRSLLMSALAVI